MGKKNKKIEIRLSDEELIPATIGTLEEVKKGSLGLIVLFLIFILFAIFLPNITDYVNKLLGKDNNNVTLIPEDNIVNEDEEDEEEISKMYDLTDNLEIIYNNIKFSNFTKYELNKTYYISFNLENKSNDIIDFETNRYYLETYSDDKTLLRRHIFSNSKLNLKSYITQSLEITEEEYNSVSKILITQKTIEDYPEVSLKENDNNQYTLTCEKNTNNIVYTFDKEANLIRIKDTINILNDNSTFYSQSLSLYQTQVANLNNTSGISSSLVEVSTGFTVTTDISVVSANMKEINNDNYYSKANPKIIDFEMKARGYNCQ